MRAGVPQSAGARPRRRSEVSRPALDAAVDSRGQASPGPEPRRGLRWAPGQALAPTRSGCRARASVARPTAVSRTAGRCQVHQDATSTTSNAPTAKAAARCGSISSSGADVATCAEKVSVCVGVRQCLVRGWRGESIVASVVDVKFRKHPGHARKSSPGIIVGQDAWAGYDGMFIQRAHAMTSCRARQTAMRVFAFRYGRQA
jgi:hypothetical protein